jgi:hypothetical protein
MAAVSSVNLIIHKGTYFEETFSLIAEDGLGLNLTNSTVTARLKKHPTAETQYSFSTFLTISDSSVKISMSPQVTSTLPSGRCVYDIILITSTGIISKVAEGTVIVEETISV